MEAEEEKKKKTQSYCCYCCCCCCCHPRMGRREGQTQNIVRAPVYVCDCQVERESLVGEKREGKEGVEREKTPTSSLLKKKVSSTCGVAAIENKKRK